MALPTLPKIHQLIARDRNPRAQLLVGEGGTTRYLTSYSVSAAGAKRIVQNVVPVPFGFLSTDSVIQRVVGAVSGTINVYDPAQSATLSLFQSITENFISHAAISDGTVIAMSRQAAAPRLVVYRLNPTVYEKITDPPDQPSAGGKPLRFSPDGAWLAYLSGNSLLIYTHSSGSFSLSQTLTATGCTSVAWSTDSTYVVVGCIDATNTLRVFKETGGTFSQLATPTSLASLNGAAYDVAWADSTRFAVGGNSTATPFNIWKNNGSDQFIRQSDLPSMPTGLGAKVGWSSGGGFLAFMCANDTSTKYLHTYSRDEDTFTKLPDTSPPPAPYSGTNNLGPVLFLPPCVSG